MEGFAGGGADGEPVEAQGVAAGDPVLAGERQKGLQGLELAEVFYVGLILGDDEGEAGDFGGEIAQLDASEVGDGDVAFAAFFTALFVDLVFNLAHFAVGDDEKVATAAGGVKHADAGKAFAQVEQFDFVAARVGEFGADVVEEERVEHFEDVGHAGVVHAQLAALFVVGHGLNHGAEDVGVDLRPVEAADVDEVGTGGFGETRHFRAV